MISTDYECHVTYYEFATDYECHVTYYEFAARGRELVISPQNMSIATTRPFPSVFGHNSMNTQNGCGISV
jgi:hypothetical protein